LQPFLVAGLGLENSVLTTTSRMSCLMTLEEAE
jgi:hypothetical protein